LSRIIQTRRYRLEFDRIAKLGFGGLLGVAVYLMLHPDILGLLAASAHASVHQGSIHFLYGYFFEARFYRHLPELAVFVFCFSVHIWRRDYRQWPFPIIAGFATFLIGFFIVHHNYFYTPFWYFPAFLVVFMTASAAWRPVVLPVLVLALFVPQYAVGYVEGHKYARQSELQVARSAIASRGADSSHAHIFCTSHFCLQTPLVRMVPVGPALATGIPPGTIY
jgi:hypothetical protein